MPSAKPHKYKTTAALLALSTRCLPTQAAVGNCTHSSIQHIMSSIKSTSRPGWLTAHPHCYPPTVGHAQQVPISTTHVNCSHSAPLSLSLSHLTRTHIFSHLNHSLPLSLSLFLSNLKHEHFHLANTLSYRTLKIWAAYYFIFVFSILHFTVNS